MYLLLYSFIFILMCLYIYMCICQGFMECFMDVFLADDDMDDYDMTDDGSLY